MNDLRKAAEMALERLESHDYWADDEAIKALRQALAQEEKPAVKTYCGGKPNYCTPQPEVCCGEYARCLKVCIPKERWFAQQKLNVDAANMTPDRVDETAKGEHVIDFTDEQLIEEVRRRGFVIRNAQVGKKWVGLTDEEIKKIAKKHKWHDGNVEPHLMPVFRSLESKLREKNGG